MALVLLAHQSLQSSQQLARDANHVAPPNLEISNSGPVDTNKVGENTIH